MVSDNLALQILHSNSSQMCLVIRCKGGRGGGGGEVVSLLFKMHIPGLHSTFKDSKSRWECLFLTTALDDSYDQSRLGKTALRSLFLFVQVKEVMECK